MRAERWLTCPPGADDLGPGLGHRQDHGHAGPAARAVRGWRGGAAVQVRAGLHRPRLSPGSDRAGVVQPRQLGDAGWSARRRSRHRPRGPTSSSPKGRWGFSTGWPRRARPGTGASAEVAARMGWPVVLVIDVGGQAQSAAATALGFARYRPDLPVAGVILNRVASPRHERADAAGDGARRASRCWAPCPGAAIWRCPSGTWGWFRRSSTPTLRPRSPTYAAFLRAHVDVDGDPVGGARAPARPGRRPAPAAGAAHRAGAGCGVLVSSTRIFWHGWRAGGAEIAAVFAAWPTRPPTRAPICAGCPAAIRNCTQAGWRRPGGFGPGCRAFAAGQARAWRMRRLHGAWRGAGRQGRRAPPDGGAAGAGHLLRQTRRMHLGYRRASLLAPLPGFAAGAVLRGHEFHYSTILEQPDAPLARVVDAEGAAVPETGIAGAAAFRARSST